MNLRLLTTTDGSHTLFSNQFKESYHSVHGAVSESMHVYINDAFNQHPGAKISLLEVGFGTGLNALLTYLEATKTGRQVHYTSIELYPLLPEQAIELNYPEILSVDRQTFIQMHLCEWDHETILSDFFTLKKIKIDLKLFQPVEKYDVVYFDAFSPTVQPELWEYDVLEKITGSMNPGAILTTYSSQGNVRRNLIKTGLDVEKIPGPAGKREMLRGIKKL